MECIIVIWSDPKLNVLFIKSLIVVATFNKLTPKVVVKHVINNDLICSVSIILDINIWKFTFKLQILLQCKLFSC